MDKCAACQDKGQDCRDCEIQDARAEIDRLAAQLSTLTAANLKLREALERIEKLDRRMAQSGGHAVEIAREALKEGE